MINEEQHKDAVAWILETRREVKKEPIEVRLITPGRIRDKYLISFTLASKEELAFVYNHLEESGIRMNLSRAISECIKMAAEHVSKKTGKPINPNDTPPTRP